MEQSEKLAKEYVDDVYKGDPDFLCETENVISWILEKHYIIEKSEIEKLGLDLEKLSKSNESKSISC